MTIRETFMTAAKYGDLKTVADLLVESTLKDNTDALCAAARRGHAEVVNLLIPVSDPKDNDSMALLLAAENGYADCVKLLIPVSDSNKDNAYALSMSAKYGHLEVVKALIPVSNLKDNNSLALAWASENGHTETVKLLIPCSDPKANNSLALRMAAKNGHQEIINLLGPVSETERAAINFINHDKPETADLLIPHLSHESILNLIKLMKKKRKSKMLSEMPALRAHITKIQLTENLDALPQMQSRRVRI